MAKPARPNRRQERTRSIPNGAVRPTPASGANLTPTQYGNPAAGRRTRSIPHGTTRPIGPYNGKRNDPGQNAAYRQNPALFRSHQQTRLMSVCREHSGGPGRALAWRPRAHALGRRYLRRISGLGGVVFPCFLDNGPVVRDRAQRKFQAGLGRAVLALQSIRKVWSPTGLSTPHSLSCRSHRGALRSTSRAS